MQEPKKEPQEEPRRTSQPNPGQQPMTPMEPPTAPGTEYEKQVPHQGNQPIAESSASSNSGPNPRLTGADSRAIGKMGQSGEGSYEGTRDYDEGLEKFTQSHPPDESVRKGKQIDPNDPELAKAEAIGKSKQANVAHEGRKSGDGRASAPSVA